MVFNAEKYLNKKITKLVITVPANFSDSQRLLTRQAAEALQLKVLRIINEPTAAALAYGFDEKKNQNSNILVFDLGGGTFDVSILSLQKNEQDNKTSFEVLGTGGDTNLGGEDFDKVLVDIVLRKNPDLDADKIRQDKKAMKKLKVACENAKKILSISDKANICINDVMKDIDIIEIIYRKEFEKECQPLFDKLIEPIEKALTMAKEKVKQNTVELFKWIDIFIDSFVNAKGIDAFFKMLNKLLMNPPFKITELPEAEKKTFFIDSHRIFFYFIF